MEESSFFRSFGPFGPVIPAVHRVLADDARVFGLEGFAGFLEGGLVRRRGETQFGSRMFLQGLVVVLEFLHGLAVALLTGRLDLAVDLGEQILPGLFHRVDKGLARRIKRRIGRRVLTRQPTNTQ